MPEEQNAKEAAAALNAEIKELLTRTSSGPSDTRHAKIRATADNMPTKDANAYLEEVKASLLLLLAKVQERNGKKKGKELASFLMEGAMNLESSDDENDDDDFDDSDEDGNSGDLGMKKRKKRRTERNVGNTKTVLENRPELHKRQCAARYVAAVGGREKWKVAEFFRAFLVNASLPTMFDTRLTVLVNTSPALNKAFAILKEERTGGILKEDLQRLGELVLADAAGQAITLYAAYAKHVKDGYRWSEKALTIALEEQTKIMVAIALRNADGIAEGNPEVSFGDMFSKVKEESDDDTRTGRSNRKDNRDNRSSRKQDEKHEKRNPSLNPKAPAWVSEKPKNISSDVKCSSCAGWGHKMATCRKTVGFGGFCSHCHGSGHKMSDCASK